jgi:enamine deaminase RidA (YjgF/YER057c/UK114 family)
VTGEGSRPVSTEQRLKELGIKLPVPPAVAREHLGSLNRVTRIIRLAASVGTSGDVRDQPKVADAASELLQDVFEKDKSPCRLAYGVASLPLGTPVELEATFEVT